MIRPNAGRLLRLGLLLALVGILQSVKHEFRTGSYRSPSEPIGATFDRLLDLLRHSSHRNWIQRGALRAGDSSLGVVLKQTPQSVPFWQGKSYVDLWLIPVPRMIWKDKPSWELWNQFGHRYHILKPRDIQTSVQISYLAEGYANFGYLGLWAAALLLGLLLGTADRLVAPDSKAGNLFGFIVFTRIFFIPADAFTILSQLYQLMALVTLLWGLAYLRGRMQKLNPVAHLTPSPKGH